jgi:hypothetical protein
MLDLIAQPILHDNILSSKETVFDIELFALTAFNLNITTLEASG